ncbi:NAD(P)H-dependent glycerol-3-phosphate dehydrogenase [Listeria booriae]|uniref:Glycerol-3-phosphate dehydrogenase [NAD(P)+] n=1 Tax=Listeria booriae TaxID=1552123 RepID=A0A841ZFM3_9LIST|nr:NAD(P)H-dependent glycerol-3-phosphate dehydrogenase [Listeria booriae]MBC1512769.1 NAD(P)H-dependent glycerol-3-phosphate dehydrogenase [Listeria booriae]MBC1557605.1 NAD(P)H-dependent glycerol-3-phosphate dehydrogenase [Listeria booriae]MBC1897232.1 NAD(P)H-dependent glycerol-3-phosphate dehydrogenase [Listeria booriae]MBC2004109.1 NAD(P)H-dependent glycerol-3-phosphate dehydrogenase [Listeria booriae]MBC2056954.1 NAD(P)H-dependent glycerol-3-phosphate dehydrogenase [Listeria booriae]
MTKKQKVAVLGAGSWGTGLALVLIENGHDVVIWGNHPEVVDELNTKHTNQHYLPDMELSPKMRATLVLEEALEGAQMVVIAIPTSAMRIVCSQLNDALKEPTLLVHVSKGIEPDTNLRMTQVIEEEVAPEKRSALVVLSGPSHAEEVVRHHPTTLCASCKDLEAAEIVQDAFLNNNLRIYTNEDVIGAEIGGALKNIIALGAGITDGLGYGDNAKAALMTRGMAEITRLGVTAGADPQTFYGLTGIGDLIVTCTSVHSRNWRAGNMLGKGESLDKVLENMGMVVEGVRTAKAVHQWAQKLQIDMPITEAIYKVLFEDENPQTAVDRLMGRDRKLEKEEY